MMYRLPALKIAWPRPSDDDMNSPMIAPIRAKPTVSLRPAKMSVSERRHHKFAEDVALRGAERAHQVDLVGSTLMAPLYEVSRATTTTDSVAIATFEARPVPNQMIMIGASAMIGSEPSATMNG